MVRIGFFGVGGVGGWLGARVAERGEHEVVLFARGLHGAAMKERGLSLRVRSGGETGPLQEVVQIAPGAVEVYGSVAEAIESGARPLDCLVLCVKSWQVREAAAVFAPLLAPEGFMVTTQNGIEAPHDAAQSIGHERVVGGIAKVLAFIAESGIVEMQDVPASFHFGEVFTEGGAPASAPASARVEILARVFGPCKGISSAVARPTTWAALWEKAVFMCCLGPVGALCRAPIDKLCSIAETRALLRAAMLEVALCAQAAGHLPDGTTPAALADEALSKSSRSKPGVTPSTLRDVVTGRPSELHQLSGAIRRAGRALGVPTPTHDLVFAALLPQEGRARGEEPYELMGVPGGAPHVREAA